MRDYLKRLERIENGLHQVVAWGKVCDQCRADGLTSTPYEHCEAKRCNEGKRAWRGITNEQIELMRVEWKLSLQERGGDAAAELKQWETEDGEKRAAWDAKKARTEP